MMRKKTYLTMEAVALKAGVSITTVSHVINKTRHVSSETKNTVLKVMKDLNYQSTRAHKPHSRNIFIGVIIADIREDYYAAMIKAIESVAADYGISIIFCDSEVDPEREKKNINFLLEQDVNGLILAPVDNIHLPRQLFGMPIPVVLIDRQYESHNFLFVGINNFQSSYKGYKYLIEKQSKSIGFIGYSDSVYTMKQRILGYKAALIETDPSRIPQILYLNYNKEDSGPLIKQFVFEQHLDGLICANSSICYEVIEVIDTLNAETQKRIKIISYDDNRWLDYLKFQVSIIAQPIVEIGNAAVENLLQMVRNKKTDYGKKRELFFDITIIDRIT